ncbi:hypothetical protein NDU88_004373 [Pleurodeles waltl]|uniref:Uncharacterized protein n=1 Tax=Pleurodeles waltl TaxID=8319 RepID=A0AAV7MW87_PLEWA|nr:hypothetical protein NDU88_004373 [Pleurodeles waltl]
MSEGPGLLKVAIWRFGAPFCILASEQTATEDYAVNMAHPGNSHSDKTSSILNDLQELTLSHAETAAFAECVSNDPGEGQAPQLATGHKQRVKGVNAKPHKKPRTNKASGNLAADLQPDRSPLADNGPDFNGEVIESNESERTLHASLIKLLQDMSRLTESSEITSTEASDHLSNVNYEEYRVPPPAPLHLIPLRPWLIMIII